MLVEMIDSRSMRLAVLRSFLVTTLALAGGVGDDGADRQIGPVGMAVVPRQMDAARVIVDMRDPQMLARRIGLGQAAGEEAVGLLQSFEMQRGFGTLMEHGANLRTTRAIVASNLIQIGYPFRMK